MFFEFRLFPNLSERFGHKYHIEKSVLEDDTGTARHLWALL